LDEEEESSAFLYILSHPPIFWLETIKNIEVGKIQIFPSFDAQIKHKSSAQKNTISQNFVRQKKQQIIRNKTERQKGEHFNFKV